MVIEKFVNNKISVYLIFIILFIVGGLTYDDYGIGIDDKFHRLNGFYWLNYLLSFTNFESLKLIVDSKLNSIQDHSLPSVERFSFYSIIFDLPASYLEVLLNLKNNKDFYITRHFLNFIYFYIGSIFFYKILNLRFNNLISLLGLVLFILTPRIYGESFYNMKDIIFLTFLTISYFYCLKCFLNFDLKNLILLSIFSAICIQIRVIGVLVPLSYLFFYYLSFLTQKKHVKEIGQIIIFIFFTIILTYILWPYLWSSPIYNFIKAFDNIIPSQYIFFNGNFLNNDYLPFLYLPTWIFISTPIYHLFLFFFGFIFLSRRIFNRIIKIEKIKNYYDLWRNEKEKFDYYIYLNFFLLFILLIFLNIRLFNAWKHVYFAHFYIIYIGVYFLHHMFSFNKNKTNIKILISIFLIFISLTIYRMYKYHPYQGLYFNAFLTNNYKNKFEIDFTALSARHFFDNIFQINHKKEKINIATASWTPLVRTLDIYDLEDRRKINLVGQNYNIADYIYTNNISEVDKRFNNKYDIPKNFIKLYDFKIDGALIYSVFERGKQ